MSGREAETGRWEVVETKVRRARRRRKKDLDWDVWCERRKGGFEFSLEREGEGSDGTKAGEEDVRSS